VPEAVDAWRGELQTKNKGKIAGSIAHPSVNGELFEEGWEEALAREVAGTADVNGDSGECCMGSPALSLHTTDLVELDIDISPSESGEACP